MNAQSLILFLLIGLIAGYLAERIMKGGRFGLIGDLIVGVIGAFIGGWLFGVLGIHIGAGIIGSLVTALVGAIVLLYLLRLIKRL